MMWLPWSVTKGAPTGAELRPGRDYAAHLADPALRLLRWGGAILPLYLGLTLALWLGLMLSGESAVGKYPGRAVEAMAEIIEGAETYQLARLRGRDRRVLDTGRYRAWSGFESALTEHAQRIVRRRSGR